MSINKLFAVLDCQPTTPNRLRGEARNGRRAIYVDRSRRPDGDLRDKPGCVPASGCTKGAPWRATRCIGPDGSPVGGAQQRRLSPYLVSQEEKPSKSARGAGPPGKAKARSGHCRCRCRRRRHECEHAAICFTSDNERNELCRCVRVLMLDACDRERCARGRHVGVGMRCAEPEL